MNCSRFQIYKNKNCSACNIMFDKDSYKGDRIDGKDSHSLKKKKIQS